jgi:hypothetical protein
MPMKTVISLIVLVSIFTFSYFQITERLNNLETQDTLMQSDLLKKAEQTPKNLEMFMLIEELYKQTDKHQTLLDKNIHTQVKLDHIAIQLEKALNDIEKLFGKKVAKIIDGLTKIQDVFDKNVSMQAENFRKMLLTLSDDVRVILIKLADRLHNMRTLEAMPKAKQLKIASETLYLYGPLAHRLGLYSIKTELEDLGLKFTKPEVYKAIAEGLNETKEERTKYIAKFCSSVTTFTLFGLFISSSKESKLNEVPSDI